VGLAPDVSHGCAFFNGLLGEEYSMFHQIKPGHVLRFEVDPGGIASPGAAAALHRQDISLETPWPTTSSNLGIVQVLSHTSEPIGKIAADVAKKLDFSLTRLTLYSRPEPTATPVGQMLGFQNCDFVGYTDGKAHYINSNNSVFSKDFSGCTMVVYTQAGERRVAHVAASADREMNCKQAFMTRIRNNGAELIGWFKPYDAEDFARKMSAFGVISKYVGGDINRLTTFGVVTAANMAYSLDAFKPVGVGTNNWVVTYIALCHLNRDWNVP